jgi:hypothetical protein
MKGKKALALLLAVCVALYSTGCASIVSKSSYTVAINSHPDKASFRIDDEDGNTVHAGTTPATVTLDAGGAYFDGYDYMVTFDKPGYSGRTVQLSSSIDLWYVFGNLFIGGLIGWVIVDPLTGAMWKLKSGLNVSLQEQ